MKDYATFQPIYGIILLLSLLFFLYLKIESFKAMVYATGLAYGIVGSVITLVFLKNYLVFTVDRSWLSIIWKYSSFAVIGGISFTLYTNVDRIMINYYMDTESVGIYGVYYYASFTILTLISGVFTTVFFPTASKSHGKIDLYKKLNKAIPYLLILGILAALIGEYVILNLFGNGYPMHFPLMFIFAIAATLVIWYDIYVWFFNSEGVDGSKLTVSGTLIIAVANIILNIILIPKMGLYGAIGATAISFALGLYYHIYQGRRFFHREVAQVSSERAN